MPLIQSAIALKYGRPIDEVAVGVQDPDGGALEEAIYTPTAITSALEEFQQLGDGVRRLNTRLGGGI